MILYRTVMQAKFGKSDELVAQMKEMIGGMPDEQTAALQPRILTDISGPFFTVVFETTHESLAAFEKFREAMFSGDNDASDDDQMAALIESGRNEYYTIEF